MDRTEALSLPDAEVAATIRRIRRATSNRRAAVASVAEFLRFNTSPEQRMRLFRREEHEAAAQAAIPQGETS